MEIDGQYAGKTPAAQTRDRARAFLDMAIRWIGDGERQAAGVPDSDLAFGGSTQRAGAGILSAIPRNRRACLAQLLQLRADVELNLGAESLLDRALIALKQTPQQAPQGGARKATPKQRSSR